MSALIWFITADDAGLRRVSELLATRGWRVVHAGTGRDRSPETSAPDLVLLDTTLRDTELPAVLHRLRAGAQGPDPPVLVLADRDRAEAALAAFRAGADDAVFKPVDPLGLPSRIEGLLQRRRLREAEERLQTLEFRNQELESFVYIVTHDMKTPVVNLQGLVGLVEQDHGASLPEEVRDYLGRLRRNAERLEELLRDLLEYPRRLSVVGPRTAQPLGPIVEAAVDGLRENAEAAGVRVLIDADLPTAPCDPKRVQQVFHNLVENAIKHASTADEPRVEIGARELGEGVRCHVRDNGPGLPADQHAEIFRLFHRGPDAQAEGTGIGLAVARHLVEAHGGEIWVESEPGRGATFLFTLGTQGER
jgi:signal transduction histidine kinase